MSNNQNPSKPRRGLDTFVTPTTQKPKPKTNRFQNQTLKQVQNRLNQALNFMPPIQTWKVVTKKNIKPQMAMDYSDPNEKGMEAVMNGGSWFNYSNKPLFLKFKYLDGEVRFQEGWICDLAYMGQIVQHSDHILDEGGYECYCEQAMETCICRWSHL